MSPDRHSKSFLREQGYDFSPIFDVVLITGDDGPFRIVYLLHPTKTEAAFLSLMLERWCPKGSVVTIRPI